MPATHHNILVSTIHFQHTIHVHYFLRLYFSCTCCMWNGSRIKLTIEVVGWLPTILSWCNDSRQVVPCHQQYNLVLAKGQSRCGLAWWKKNGSLPLVLWPTSLVGWLPGDWDQQPSAHVKHGTNFTVLPYNTNRQWNELAALSSQH